MTIAGYTTARKTMLIAGSLVGLICLVFIYPKEHSTASYVTDYSLTFTTLATSAMLLLYGFTGPGFFKYILFTFLSAIVCATFWYVYSFWDIWQKLAVVWIGIPSGIITALMFFILRYLLFLRNKDQSIQHPKTSNLLLKQVLLYIFLAIVISILFLKGGDWWFELFES